MADLSMPLSMPGTGRRLIAAGIIRRTAGRTLTVRATAAGVTGTITSIPQARMFDDDSDDVCPVCGRWACTCGSASRLGHHEAVAAR